MRGNYSRTILVVIFSCFGLVAWGQGFQKIDMLEAINQIRSQGRYCGDEYYPATKSVKWNDRLELIANKHSGNMYKYNFFAHKGIDGKRIGDRAEDLGYDFKEIGENIATGYKSIASVLVAWLESPEHCQCIMNPLFTETGVSRVGDYWTQVFAITRHEAWIIYKKKRAEYFSKGNTSASTNSNVND